jgi:hypothetical protein
VHAEPQRIAHVGRLAAVTVAEREREPGERRAEDGSRRERRDDAEATAHAV